METHNADQLARSAPFTSAQLTALAGHPGTRDHAALHPDASVTELAALLPHLSDDHLTGWLAEHTNPDQHSPALRAALDTIASREDNLRVETEMHLQSYIDRLPTVDDPTTWIPSALLTGSLVSSSLAVAGVATAEMASRASWPSRMRWLLQPAGQSLDPLHAARGAEGISAYESTSPCERNFALQLLLLLRPDLSSTDIPWVGVARAYLLSRCGPLQRITCGNGLSGALDELRSAAGRLTGTLALRSLTLSVVHRLLTTTDAGEMDILLDHLFLGNDGWGPLATDTTVARWMPYATEVLTTLIPHIGERGDIGAAMTAQRSAERRARAAAAEPWKQPVPRTNTDGSSPIVYSYHAQVLIPAAPWICGQLDGDDLDTQVRVWSVVFSLADSFTGTVAELLCCARALAAPVPV